MVISSPPYKMECVFCAHKSREVRTSHTASEHICGVCSGMGHPPWDHCRVCGDRTHAMDYHSLPIHRPKVTILKRGAQLSSIQQNRAWSDIFTTTRVKPEFKSNPLFSLPFTHPTPIKEAKSEVCSTCEGTFFVSCPQCKEHIVETCTTCTGKGWFLCPCIPALTCAGESRINENKV